MLDGAGIGWHVPNPCSLISMHINPGQQPDICVHVSPALEHVGVGNGVGFGVIISVVGFFVLLTMIHPTRAITNTASSNNIMLSFI
jgi:hypothetical protein